MAPAVTGEGTLQVSGGVAGVTADLALMRVAAATLVAAGRALGEVGAQVAGVAADPALLPGAVVDPAGWAHVESLLVPLVAGSQGLLVIGTRVATLGVAVGAAAAAYQGTDVAVTALLTGVRDQVAEAVGAGLAPTAVAVTLPVTAWVALRALPLLLDEERRLLTDLARGRFDVSSLDDRARHLERALGAALGDDVAATTLAATRWLARHPGAAQHLAGAAPSLLDGVTGPLRTGSLAPGTSQSSAWPPDDVGDLAAALTGLGLVSPWLRTDLPVRVAPSGTGRTAAPPRGVADLLGRVAPLSPPVPGGAGIEAYGPQRMRVDRLDGPGGRRWIVTLPPTQTWSMGTGRNPFDGASNVHALAGAPSASARAAVGAMKAAGVRPGEPVLLVGYSQGGLTAAQVAAEAGVNHDLNVMAVLTAAAPIGLAELPPQVAVLSLEHRQDLVVAAEGRDNPDLPSWTTVRRDLLVGPGEDPRVAQALEAKPWAAHELSPYLRTAALVDASRDASVRGWLGRVDPFLAGPGVTATATYWGASRDGP